MPATVPTPARDTILNYPPAAGDALVLTYTQGAPFFLALPITYALADAAVLFTVPTGMRLFIHRTFWEVTTGFSGGSSSAIGVSSSATGFTTKGDLLGGATGDVAATLVAGIAGGTIGTKFGTNGVIVLPAASTIRYDKITSTFTAGVGIVHVFASLLPSS